jgi:hypothetical protein
VQEEQPPVAHRRPLAELDADAGAVGHGDLDALERPGAEAGDLLAAGHQFPVVLLLTHLHLPVVERDPVGKGGARLCRRGAKPGLAAPRGFRAIVAQDRLRQRLQRRGHHPCQGMSGGSSGHLGAR